MQKSVFIDKARQHGKSDRIMPKTTLGVGWRKRIAFCEGVLSLGKPLNSICINALDVSSISDAGICEQSGLGLRFSRGCLIANVVLHFRSGGNG